MTTWNSTQYGNIPSLTAAGSPIAAAFGGKATNIRTKYAKLEATVGLAQNDLVNLFTLPAGVIPIAHVTTYGAFGASVTLDIGWSGDENALESGLDVATAGTTLALVDDATPLAAAKIVQAKFEGANPADDKTLEIWLIYLDPSAP